MVGLGNPGQKYQQTRHNVGFLFLDAVFAEKSVGWSWDARFEGLLSYCLVNGSKIHFLKPETFMNRSGHAVGKLAKYYKLSADEILVVHDELDFEMGVAKLKKGGGHAGHNGLRDIIAHLGASDFYRLRIGIGRPLAGKNVADYVLSNFTAREVELLKQVFAFCQEPVEQLLTGEVDKAMNKLNAGVLIN